MNDLFKNIFLLTFLMIVSSVLYAQAEPEEKDVEVVAGIDRILKFDFQVDPKNITNSKDDVITYKLILKREGSEIVLNGIKPGPSTLTIRNQVGDIQARYNITVIATDQSKVVQELKELLGDIEGLDIGIKGNLVYVDGQIVVPTDSGRVTAVLNNAKYSDVLRLFDLAPTTQAQIAKKMQDEIQKNQLRNVTVRVVNGLYWLEGIVSSDGEKVRANEIAIAYLPDTIPSLANRTGTVSTVNNRSPIQNFISVNQQSKPPPIPKLIKVSAQFVELTKDYNKIFGFKWTPLLGGDGGQINIGKTQSDGVTTNSSGTLSATISNLFPKLASAKSAGYARVIQSGVVVIKNTITGKINKTHSKPFGLGTGDFIRPQAAESGFDLSVTPTILPEEKIDLNVGISVSASVGDPPETTKNTVSTSLVVKSKDSAVVGGIVINRSSTDFDRNSPFGADDQVEGGSPLFSFLRSKSYITNKSQFVVFITPEIIDNATTGTEEIKRKFRRRRN